MSKIDIKPATEDSIEEYYGRKAPQTIRGFVAVKDDKVVGIAGYYLFDHKIVMFADLNKELKIEKRVLVKGIQMVMDLIENTKLPIYAMCDRSIEGAEMLLSHTGFVNVYGDVWQLSR